MALRRRQLNAKSWRTCLRPTRRRPRGVPLFAAVASAVLIGVALIWLGFTVFGHVVGTDDKTRSTRADVLKTALSAVAGVGGAVALVVAYRRQQDLEEGRFVERFGAAAAQLGNPEPAVRIAGVYALAGVADERGTTFSRRQQCIDVLGGYLRLPYDPAHGESHITELVTTTRVQGTQPEEARHQTIRQNDREVRQTIVRVISAHLQKAADVSWSAHDFDFTAVLFEEADFSNALFSGKTTTFHGATFTGITNFSATEFAGEINSFKNAKFTGEDTFALFESAIFSGEVLGFIGTQFTCRTASFTNLICSGDESMITFERAEFDVEVARFDDAEFGVGTTSFEKAVFVTKVTSFDGTQFSGSRTTFENAVLDGKEAPPKATLLDSTSTSFGKAIFSGDTVSYAGARFGGTTTSFTGAEFHDTAISFDRVQFMADQINFDETKFSGEAATFKWARFNNTLSVLFDNAQFNARITSFESATFSNMTSFTRATFAGGVINFADTKFVKSLTSFPWAVFSAADTKFVGTEFRGTTVFSEAVFEGPAATVVFEKVTFGGDSNGHTSFDGATFKNKLTSFSQPRVWNVSFAWDFALDEMPPCIRPRAWPPPLLGERGEAE
jgi:uncharacterized protein YjbI with pentapeptide repeats